MRKFKTFRFRDASYRISPGDNDLLYTLLCSAVEEIRGELEAYIKIQPDFLTSLTPLELLPEAPDTALRMAAAAELAGTGPMAAVAGLTAQSAVERAAEKYRLTLGNAAEIIIENGGDIFISPAPEDTRPVTAGIFSGLHSNFSSLALKIIPPPGGIAVCSSSGRMGHSLSFGDCDLCTVVSTDAALADAAATLGGNLVRTEADLGPAAEKLVQIDGINGVLLIKNDKLAIAGKMPELVRHKDPGGLDKITGTFII